MAAQVESIKWVPGTKFMVDGFRFQSPQCQSYFLTHFHSDHTTGLNKGFASGLVYCSPITATLLRHDMGLPAQRICQLPVGRPHNIDGVEVTLLDANHCPGAVMILFKVPRKGSGQAGREVILHTGDMRWQPWMAAVPALKGVKIDILFMDTTYALPKHIFPSQDEAVAKVVEIMQKADLEDPCTLFVMGAYHIGKERAFLGAAHALSFRVWCNPSKMRVMQMLALPQRDMGLLVRKPDAARIHVVFMGQGLQPEALEERMRGGRWNRVVAFRPTGWSFQKSGKLQVRRQGPVTIYGIPYSEHSSFIELRDCVKRLRPRRLVPTVNINDTPASVRVIVDRFADLMDLSGDRSRLDRYFRRSTSQKGQGTCQPATPPLQPAASAPASLQAATSAPAVQGDGAEAIPASLAAEALDPLDCVAGSWEEMEQQPWAWEEEEVEGDLAEEAAVHPCGDACDAVEGCSTGAANLPAGTGSEPCTAVGSCCQSSAAAHDGPYADAAGSRVEAGGEGPRLQQPTESELGCPNGAYDDVHWDEGCIEDAEFCDADGGEPEPGLGKRTVEAPLPELAGQACCSSLALGALDERDEAGGVSSAARCPSWPAAAADSIETPSTRNDTVCRSAASAPPITRPPSAAAARKGSGERSGLFDRDSVDVKEQKRILAEIQSGGGAAAAGTASSLRKKRQATMSAFLLPPKRPVS